MVFQPVCPANLCPFCSITKYKQFMTRSHRVPPEWEVQVSQGWNVTPTRVPGAESSFRFDPVSVGIDVSNLRPHQKIAVKFGRSPRSGLQYTLHVNAMCTQGWSCVSLGSNPEKLLNTQCSCRASHFIVVCAVRVSFPLNVHQLRVSKCSLEYHCVDNNLNIAEWRGLCCHINAARFLLWGCNGRRKDRLDRHYLLKENLHQELGIDFNLLVAEL